MDRFVAVIFVFGLFLSGCAGPLLSHETGRSLGKGRHGVRIMSSTEGYYGFRYDQGVLDDLDVGFHFEKLSVGANVKYAFINEDRGFSLAGALGLGGAWGGQYISPALLAGYVIGGFEPFAGVRFTNVTINPDKVDDARADDVFSGGVAKDYSYALGMIGAKYWFAEAFALSLETSVLLGATADITFNSRFSASFACELRI